MALYYSMSFLFQFSSYVKTGLLWDLAHPWDLEDINSVRKRLSGSRHWRSWSFSPDAFCLPGELGLCYLVRECVVGVGWGGGRVLFLWCMAPNQPAWNPTLRTNAAYSALSPTKSPLLSICKQLSSACIICEQAMPAPHCALPCSQPSAPAARGSGCRCRYCCYYALPSLALLLAGLAAHLWHGEECLLVLIGGHGWTVTFGGDCVSSPLYQVPAAMADVGGSTQNTTYRWFPFQNNAAAVPLPYLGGHTLPFLFIPSVLS